MDRIDGPVVWSCLVYCLESVQQQIQRKDYQNMATVQGCFIGICHSPWTANLRSCLSQSSHHVVFHIPQVNCTFMDSLNCLLSISELLPSEISYGKECSTLVRCCEEDCLILGFRGGFFCFLTMLLADLPWWEYWAPQNRLLSYPSVISFWSCGTVIYAVISCPEGFAFESSLSLRPPALHVRRTHGSFLCFSSFV